MNSAIDRERLRIRKAQKWARECMRLIMVEYRCTCSTHDPACSCINGLAHNALLDIERSTKKIKS